MKNTTSINPNAVCIGKKSWVAYNYAISFVAVSTFFLTAIGQAIAGPKGAILVLIGCIGWGATFLYAISYCRIFIDSEGIWARSGILPWNKGYAGVKWRDLDEAVYQPGLVSWLFDSYTVVLTHRYSKQFELRMNHIAKGREIASRINATHSQLINSGELVK